MSLVETGGAIVLTIWFGLTVIGQFQGTIVSLLTSWDKIGVLPIYRFFAPFPGRHDYHFLVRYQEADDTFSNWFEVGPDNRRRVAGVLFNPGKRLRKAQMDIITELAKELKSHNFDSAKTNLSYPYLALLLVAERFIRLHVRGFTSVRYQFLVLASFGSQGDPIEPLMLSSLHRTEPAGTW